MGKLPTLKPREVVALLESRGVGELCNQGADASICRIHGEPGIYNLEVGAPDYITQQFTVSVEGSIGECGYTIFMTQRLTVMLERASDTDQFPSDECSLGVLHRHLRQAG